MTNPRRSERPRDGAGPEPRETLAFGGADSSPARILQDLLRRRVLTADQCIACLQRLEESPGKRLREVLAETGWIAAAQLAEMSADASAAVSRDLLPASIGPYTVLRQIGTGGMGLVYEAVQPRLERRVALKVLKAGTSESALPRFELEAKALATLQHPNIVQVFEAGTWEGRPYLALEYVDGPTLAQVVDEDARTASALDVRARRQRVRERVEWMRQVAEAVQVAHQASFVHRDIKPTNILITRTRVVKLTDFGLAKRTDSDDELTRTGALLGTPQYMSPEQAASRNWLVGPRTDVWAIGAVLYEILTGTVAHAGPTAIDVIQSILSREPIPPRRLEPNLSADLETIVLKCLEKNPARRYASARDLADDLGRWLDGAPVLARPAGALYRTGKWIVRNRLVATALGTVLVSLLAFLLLTLAPGRIRLAGDLEGARVLVDGSERGGPAPVVWPPRKVRVTVLRDGFEPFEASIVVRSRTTEELEVALVSRTGRLTVETDPAGAEVTLDGSSIGRTPVRGASVATGRHRLELALAGHETVVEAPDVRPSDETIVRRALRAETGILAVTATPSQVALELVPLAGGPSVYTAAPAENLPLVTGRWRGIARARNHHPFEFEVEVAAGARIRRHVSLSPMTIWEYPGGEKGAGCAIGDVNGDPYPDVVATWLDPDRIAAIEGREGRVLWHRALPAVHWSDLENAKIRVAIDDLDGDLRPEVLVIQVAGPILVLDAETGETKRSFPLSAMWARPAPDLDGNGLTDLVVGLWPRGIAAVDGVDGRVLWKADVTTSPVHLADLTRPGADGTVDVLASAWDAVHAIDGATGRVLWSVPLPAGPGPVAWDVDGDGTDDAVQGTRDGLFALSGRDGAPLWEARIGSALSVAAIGDVDGDGRTEVVQGNDERALFVLDAATGAVEATCTDVKPSWGSPALCDVDGDRVLDVVVPSTFEVLALSVAGGRFRELWRHESGRRIYHRPLVSDLDGDTHPDVVLFDGSGAIHTFAAARVPLVWKNRVAKWDTENLLPVGDPLDSLAVVGDRVRRLSREDGGVLAEYGGEHDGYAAVAADLEADGRWELAIMGWDSFSVLEVDGGAVRWRIPTRGWSVPCLADANGDGVLDLLWGGSTEQYGASPIQMLDGGTGEVLWTAPGRHAPPGRTLASELGFVVAWQDGIQLLSPATGEEISFTPVGDRITFAGAVGPDLLVSTAGGLFVRLAAQDAGTGGFRDRWTIQIPGGVATDWALVSPGRAIVPGPEAIYGIDLDTGRSLWRRGMGGRIASRLRAHDVDEDDVPDPAVATYKGYVHVVSGADGRSLWTHRVDSHLGVVDPAWIDLDGDGRPELLLPGREGLAYALSVRVPREPPPPLEWPDAEVRTEAEARRRAARESVRSLVERLRSSDDLAGIGQAAARPEAPGLAAYYAAKIAWRGEAPEFLALASRAWDAGCRRLDLVTVHAAALGEAAGVALLARAFEVVPEAEFFRNDPGERRASLWRLAALRLHDPLRIALALSASGRWDEYESAEAIAAAAGADPGWLALARLRAARLAGLAVEADRAGTAAAGFISSRRWVEDRADPYQAHHRALWTEAHALLAKGRHAEAIPELERALRLASGDPEAWFDLASHFAEVRQYERAAEAARRAAALVEARGPAQRVSALRRLAEHELEAGRRPEAIASLEKALPLAAAGEERVAVEKRLAELKE